jgi:lipoprotein-releasing system ATP-binding protein
MAEPLLALEGVTKSFGEVVVTRVLHGIDLVLEPGSFSAIIGPSGSGKSTLLNLIGLLDRPTGGRILLEGEDISKLDDNQLSLARGRTLGFVFQFHHLLPAFTALENVMMPLMAQRGRQEPWMRERGLELLEEVGLSKRADYLANALSGGQQQRVAIARALAPRPKLVLADEPTGNLDTKTADEAFALLRRFNEKHQTAFLVVTHDPRLAERCDRIITVVDGLIESDVAHTPETPLRDR